MKALYALLYITMLSAIILSCSKKESAKPVSITPKTIDSVPAPVISYPYTDTFVGKYYDAGAMSSTVMDSPYVFFVIYPNANQVVFMNDTVIIDDPNLPRLFIDDTFSVSGYTYYQAGINTTRNIYKGYPTTGDLFQFPDIHTLQFSWSYHQDVLTCDGVDYNCGFSGTRKTK